MINTYSPDYTVPPGWLLEEHLEVAKMTVAEFALKCDYSADLINEILNGKTVIDPEIAIQFEKVLGVSANIWLALERESK